MNRAPTISDWCRNLRLDELNTETPAPGGAGRDRTDDLKLAKLALSQLSYGPAGANVQSKVDAPAPIMVGLGRLELPTSRLSGVRSNHLSYRPPLFSVRSSWNPRVTAECDDTTDPLRKRSEDGGIPLCLACCKERLTTSLFNTVSIEDPIRANS
jgi:hypothetical protein